MNASMEKDAYATALTMPPTSPSRLMLRSSCAMSLVRRPILRPIASASREVMVSVPRPPTWQARRIIA